MFVYFQAIAVKLGNALEILVKAAEGMDQSTKRMAPDDSSLPTRVLHPKRLHTSEASPNVTLQSRNVTVSVR